MFFFSILSNIYISVLDHGVGIDKSVLIFLNKERKDLANRGDRFVPTGSRYVHLQHFLNSKFLSIGYVSSVCNWPTRVAADNTPELLLLTSVEGVLFFPPPPPPPPPPAVPPPVTAVIVLLPPLAALALAFGLIGVSGRRFSWPVLAAPSRVSFGDVAGVRIPKLSYFPFGEPADEEDEDDDDDELEEDEAIWLDAAEVATATTPGTLSVTLPPVLLLLWLLAEEHTDATIDDTEDEHDDDEDSVDEDEESDDESCWTGVVAVTVDDCKGPPASTTGFWCALSWWFFSLWEVL